MHVEMFDSFEEMLASLEANRRAADEMTAPWQREIKAGDLVVALDADGSLLYHEVLDPLSGADDEELEELTGLWKQPHMACQRFVRGFGPFCPEGEFGHSHVLTIQAIIKDRTAWEAIRRAGWPSDSDGLCEVVELMDATINPAVTAPVLIARCS